MLTVLSRARRTCDGVTRRELLQAGAGMLGISLPKVLAAESISAPIVCFYAERRSCIASLNEASHYELNGKNV